MTPVSTPPDNDDTAAIAAARARLAADRQLRHLDRVLLTAAEERGLALLVRAGEDALPAGHFAHLTGERRRAADALVLHNTRLVAQIARSHMWTGLEFDDLRSHGILGLIRTVERFDPTAGTRFSTYATWWIRQSIRRGVANESRFIREPVHVFERRCKVASTETALSMDGSVPAIADVAQASGLTERQVRECRRLSVGVDSLDRRVGFMTLAEMLDLAASTDTLQSGFTADDVREAVAGLPARQADVLRRRFGLDGDRETLEQVGRHLGVTRERVRQIESIAITHLRSILIADLRDGQVA